MDWHDPDVQLFFSLIVPMYFIAMMLFGPGMDNQDRGDK